MSTLLTSAMPRQASVGGIMAFLSMHELMPLAYKHSGRDGKFDRPLSEPKDGGLQAVVEEALT